MQANGLEFQISIQCRVSISGQQEPIKAQNSKDSLAIELCTASPYRQLKSYFATGFIIRYIRLLLIMRLAGLHEEEEEEEARMKNTITIYCTDPFPRE